LPHGKTKRFRAQVTDSKNYPRSSRLNDFFLSSFSPAKEPTIANRSVRYFKNCERGVEKDSENQRNKKNQLRPTESAGPENGAGAGRVRGRRWLYRNFYVGADPALVV